MKLSHDGTLIVGQLNYYLYCLQACKMSSECNESGTNSKECDLYMFNLLDIV